MRKYINDKFPHLIHGADYNPEQWSDTKEIWDLDNERKNELEKIGIKTFYIWELDYNENFDVKKFIIETLKIEL